MEYVFFLMPLLVSFGAATIFLAALVALDRKKTTDDGRTGERHIHRKGISRFGGAALIVSFAAAILLDGRLVFTAPLAGVLVASFAILFFGIVDDLRQLSWKAQLAFQIALISFIYFAGVRLEYVTNPFGGIFLFDTDAGHVISFIIAVVWVVLLMNAVNWVDGIDGVSAGVTFIGGASIFFLSLRPEVNQPPIGIITAALLGGLLAMLLFNFNPAKILAGTSGSMFMGFILAVLAIFAGAKMATTLLVMAVPIIDALWVIGERLKSKSPVFSADRRHLHYRLLEIGWSQKKICLFYYGITASIALLALNTGAMGKAVTFLVIGAVMTGVLVMIRKKVSRKNLPI